MHIPGGLTDDIIANHSSASLKRINETVAIAFQHRNVTNETVGIEEYTSFLYFVDLQEFLPKPKDLGPRAPPEPVKVSIMSQIIEFIVQIV